LHQCLQKDALFALFSTYLRSNDVHFQCVDFIEKELKKNGLKIVDLERLFKETNPFSDERKRKNLLSRIHHYAEDNRQTTEEVLKEFLEELNSARPERVWM